MRKRYLFSTERTLRVAKALYDNGVYVNTVLPPAAPTDGCMLRTSLMATHTEALLDEALRRQTMYKSQEQEHEKRDGKNVYCTT